MSATNFGAAYLMPNVDWQLVAPGATDAARIAASDDVAAVAIPTANATLKTLKTQEFQVVAAPPDHELWPMWAVLRAGPS